jgi:hypothetical protein
MSYHGSVSGYDGYALTIIRNGGSIISGPALYTDKTVPNKKSVYLSFKHDSKKYVIMFMSSLYCFVTEVEHDHGGKHKSCLSLGEKVVRTHLIKRNEFSPKLKEILNTNHEKEAEKT